MRDILGICSLLVVVGWSGVVAGERPAGIPRFHLPDTGMKLAGPARPGVYVDALGRRAALLATEDGDHEIWVYPFKLLHHLRFHFRLDGETYPVEARSVARWVEVRPESTVITYATDGFTVREILFVPLDEPGGLLLLDIDTVRPLEITVYFKIDLLPMWPGGLGGQFSYYNAERRAFVFSESTGTYTALFGSPFITEASTQPAHMLPDAPSMFRMRITPEQARGVYVPIVFAFSIRDVLPPVEVTYQQILERAAELYHASVRYYQAWLAKTVEVITPDETVNEAFRWAKVATHKAFMCNPQLGCGLVAGFGRSGESTRPGFAWFFGGDAFINGWAFLSMGDLETFQTGLRFLKLRQRQDGKMMHELSQAGAMIPWFEKYPYGYYHADTTPYYLIAVHDYVQVSGDRDFLDEFWESVRRAYAYCKSTDTDGDGLMENPRAGLAAVETGTLLKGVYEDVYLAGVWLRALEAVAEMAEWKDDRKMAQEVRAIFAKGYRTLNERFWIPERRMYAFALAKDGDPIGELTLWPAVAVWLGVTAPTQARLHMKRIARSEMTTDWGVRMLARTSAQYDPLSYNNGSVWPFLTGFVALADFAVHLPWAGWLHTMTNARLTFDDARGYHAELYSGELFHPIQEAVPHQIFSSSMVITSILRGLLGIQVDAMEGIVRFAPHLPGDWDTVKVRNVRLGTRRVHLVIDRNDTMITLNVRVTDGEPLTVEFTPYLGWASQVVSVEIDGQVVDFKTTDHGDGLHVQVRLNVSKEATVRIRRRSGIQLIPTIAELRPGDRSRSLYIVSVDFNKAERILTLELEGPTGETACLRIRTLVRPEPLDGVVTVNWDGQIAQVCIPILGARTEEYTPRTLRLRFPDLR